MATLAIDPFTRELMLRVDELTRRVATLESSPSRMRRTAPQLILEAVSREVLLPVAAITGNSRCADIVHARRMAMWLMRDLLQFSFKRIAAEFSLRDHASCANGCAQIDWEIGRDAAFKAIILPLRDKIAARMKKEMS